MSICGPWGCYLRTGSWVGETFKASHPWLQSSRGLLSPMCHKQFCLTSHRDRQVHDSQWNYMSQAAGKHTLMKDQWSHWFFIRCFSQAINWERQGLQRNRSPVVRTCDQVNHWSRNEHQVLTQDQRVNWQDTLGVKATICKLIITLWPETANTSEHDDDRIVTATTCEVPTISQVLYILYL